MRKGTRKAPWPWLFVCVASPLTPTAAGASQCFDASQGFAAPLVKPIEMYDAGDHVEWGRRADGTSWAATRAIVDLPAEIVLAKLMDHRNLKDMKKTTLSSRSIESSDYLELRHVDVDVTVKAVFFKLHVRWTEEWAYRLVEGTPEALGLMIANYQKIAGTHHIQHQCGSYVVRRLGDHRSDLFMYEEIRAKRRSAEDTSRMHQGILSNIREDVWPTEAGPPVGRVTGAHLAASG